MGFQALLVLWTVRIGTLLEWPLALIAASGTDHDPASARILAPAVLHYESPAVSYAGLDEAAQSEPRVRLGKSVLRLPGIPNSASHLRTQ